MGERRNRETVDAFLKASVAATGRDNGGPGECGYRLSYYAAYVLDPDARGSRAI
jgi:hypothetical protein